MLGSDINACEHVLIKMVYGTVLSQQQTKTKQANKKTSIIMCIDVVFNVEVK